MITPIKIFEYAASQKVTIHCFEPVDLTFKKLKENVKPSGTHKVILNNFGFSSQPEEVENIYL